MAQSFLLPRFALQGKRRLLAPPPIDRQSECQVELARWRHQSTARFHAANWCKRRMQRHMPWWNSHAIASYRRFQSNLNVRRPFHFVIEFVTFVSVQR